MNWRDKSTLRLLLFGATGAIGGAIKQRYLASSWAVTGISRHTSIDGALIAWNPLASEPASLEALRSAGPFDAVCWAQGTNFSDHVRNFDRTRHTAMYEANVLFIVLSLQQLLDANLLAEPARLCIISSIWQQQARQDKLSYLITKSALHGLVLSLAADLGARGHLVNAVLPGVLDTPMTRQNLTAAQVIEIARLSPLGRLPKLEDVAAAVYAIASEQNTGVTGQFLTVDAGFTNVRYV
jgi:NAD(P)-dependent dehydrogenase (short-subunit alcohol dehydrogenase family)